MLDRQPSILDGASLSDRSAALARAERWAAERTFSAADFGVEELLRLKAATTVSVVIPAKQVAATIAGVTGPAVRMRDAGVVDEVIVVDAGSTDETAELATAAGATVVQESGLRPDFGPVLGKGDALWRSLDAATGEIVVFVDGDTGGFDDHFIRGLVGPLLAVPELQAVKGSFRRPFSAGAVSVPDAGGRVTELTARPLLNLFFPELSAVNQPLAGEIAVRRSALERIPVMTGYACETQMLIDLYREFGLEALAQCDLGERVNSHQPLHDLGAMAYTVLRVVLDRAESTEVAGLGFGEEGVLGCAEYLRYGESGPQIETVALVERPPLGMNGEPLGAAKGEASK